MPTFAEVLPATKSSEHNAMTWEPTGPGRGVLTVATCRAVCRYRVEEFPTAWEGRAFRLTKLDEGTDRESEAYDVFAALNPQDRSCTCKGFTYGRGKPCKHISATVEGLIANDWI